MAEWQPIETAPKDGRVVLWSRKGTVVAGFYDELNVLHPWRFVDRAGFVNGMGASYGPDHWMPLPPPPPGDST